MLNNEQILSFTEAAKCLPPINGRRVHASTVWRWGRKGVCGVKLEILRLGGRFVTSAEALERFAVALATLPPDQRLKTDNANSLPSLQKRKHAIRQAEERLQNSGI